ncbi:MAG: glycerophosphodiester phosphodiesterase family protein [Actinomycetota bacterium]
MKPLVLGHRGASGYRPENTIEAFELAFAQGADGIECDLVPTKDGELLIRHENWLDGTTNIAELPSFASRMRTGYSDGLTEKGFFSEDFLYSELGELRAKERVPDIRPGSAKFDSQFRVPRIDDLLAQSFLDNKTCVVEIKHGRYFAKLGIDVAGILAQKLERANWLGRGIRIVIESFDEEMLRLLKIACGDDKEYVFLTEAERLPKGQTLISDEQLANLAEDFDGVSVDIPMLFDVNEAGSVISNGTVERARGFDLGVYCWTLKAEDALNSVEEYFAQLALAGLDGIFVDQPDLLRQVVDGTA